MASKKYYPFLFLSFLFIYITYIFDLSNLNALRQGTEGFYLQISKEMFDLGSVLTPYYRGLRHWSKPFLHFILPFPIYFTDLFSTVHAARLAVSIFSIALTLIASKRLEKFLKINPYVILLFFLSSFGFIKYARIFMMEMPLSLLPFLSSVFLLDYFYGDKQKKSFIYSIVALALSVYIKGPVTLVLTFLSCLLYAILNYRNINSLRFKTFFIYFLSATVIASIWFVISYINYGKEFFDYFFLRENLGKFSTKTYPIRSVIQGLFFFTLPWIFLFPGLIKNYFKFRSFSYFKQDSILLFLLSHAIVFLVVWMVPTQRSHHYAMPSVPYFLTVILYLFSQVEKKSYTSIKVILFTFITIISSLLLLISTTAPSFILQENGIYYIYLSLTVFIFVVVLLLKSQSLAAIALATLAVFGQIWVVLSPVFIPQQLPEQAITIIGDKDLVGYVNKPFFIEEALGRSMEVVAARKLDQRLKNGEIYILSLNDYQKFITHECSINYTWEIWKKRTTFREVTNAIKHNDISDIKTKYVLFTCDTLN